jgi:hypothetical protein
MKRHPIDPLSFVLGAFFLITGLVFAFGGDASKLHIAWFWPVVLGVTGIGLMLLTARSVRPDRQAVAAEPATLDAAVQAESAPFEAADPAPFEAAGDQSPSEAAGDQSPSEPGGDQSPSEPGPDGLDR